MNEFYLTKQFRPTQFSKLVLVGCLTLLFVLKSAAQETPITYCTPTFSFPNADTEPITSVEFGTITNVSSALVSTETPKYEDFTNLTTDLQRGDTYTITLQGNTSGDETNYFTIYIDWNQDGVFSNSLATNERYQYTDPLINSTGTDGIYVTHDIVIPSNAVLGSTRMRVVKNYQAPSPGSCSSVATFGQVEDYSLEIIDTNSVYDVVINTPANVAAEILVSNGNLQLAAVVNPSTASQEVTWSIESNGNAISLSETGLVTAVNNGSALVRATSVEDDTVFTEIEINVNVLKAPAVTDFFEDFETELSWSFSNQNQINKWFIGVNPEDSEERVLYLSKDYGFLNEYDTNQSSTTHAYRDITIPTGATTASLTFDWAAAGDFYSGGWGDFYYDYLKVWMVPASFTPVGGAAISNGNGNIQIGEYFVNQNEITTYVNDQVEVSSFQGQTMRLVFEWINDNESGAQPAAIIDNISLQINEIDLCSPVATFVETFEGFTAIPEQCWTASHPAPMFTITGTDDKVVQVYSFFSGTSDLYLVAPAVSTIDGQHVLEFTVAAASDEMEIQIGSLASANDYESFQAIENTTITPTMGTTYTSGALPAFENRQIVALKITPNGNHKVVSFSNVEWKSTTLGITNPLKDDVQMYPNPTDGFVYINTESAVQNVYIYNQLGQLIATQKSQTIDLSSVASGMYVIQIELENNATITKKVIRN